MALPPNPAPPGPPPVADGQKNRNPAPPGRPLRADGQKLSHVVSFRLTEAEKIRLAREAAAAGIGLNECARLKVTGGAPLPPARAAVSVEPEPPGMFELRQEIRRVGVNMNQIARSLNMLGEHEPEELREASQHLNEIFLRMLEGRTLH